MPEGRNSTVSGHHNSKRGAEVVGFVGGFILGLGLGWAYAKPIVGILVGLGIGLILMALIRVFSR